MKAARSAGWRSLLSGLDGAFAEFESGLGDALARYGDRGRHRVRPHRAHQRHRRHRSRHRHGRAARRRRDQGRPRDLGLAGLKPASLYQGRDLAPTTDLRAVLKGVLADHLGIERARAGADGVSGQRRGEADEGIDRLIAKPAAAFIFMSAFTMRAMLRFGGCLVVRLAPMRGTRR